MQIKNIRTITELSRLDGRVYVHLPTEKLASRFMRQAEAEGFTFTDGAGPTERAAGGIMAVNANRTINYVGAAGHMAFGAGAKTVGGRPLIRMTYLGEEMIPYQAYCAKA